MQICKRFSGVMAAVVCVLLELLCAAQAQENAAQSANAPMLLPADKAPLVFAAPGKPAYAVEIARTEREKQRGLMNRRIFPQDRAMLFVFAPEEQVVTMWMADTPLPLDMVFADKTGKIVYIYSDAAPYSRRLISSLRPAAYAAELNAGQAAAKGLKAGQKMRHPLICGACPGE